MATRANVERALVKRAGKLMTAAEMDGQTVGGTNEDLNEPICTALLQVGVSPANVDLITDADVLAAPNYLELLDRAELRLYQTILGNLDVVNVTVGPRSEELNQLTQQVEKAIDRQTIKVNADWGGGGGGQLEAGIIALDFMQKFDTE